MLVHGSHLGGDPTTDGMAYQDVVVETQFLYQVLSEVSHVINGIDPFRTLRTEETWMRRSVYGELLS